MKFRVYASFMCIFCLCTAMMVSGCGGGGDEEITLEEAMGLKNAAQNEILQKTVYKPGYAGLEMEIGDYGGTWISTINNDPKSFNELNARDGDTGTVIGPLTSYLADYDMYTKEWTPHLASFEIIPHKDNDTLDVIYTLRDDVFWTTPDGKIKIKLTSDDFVFWYNEIEGDPEMQHPGYAGQFVDMPDGSKARTEIEKLTERKFVFHFPRIVAEPIFQTNTTVWPAYLFEPAKKEGGAEAVYNILGVDTDVMTLPSIGEYQMVEYTPGVRVVYRRNPDYWKKDKKGNRLPYMEKYILRIVPDKNAEFLMFKEGTEDGYGLRPEDLDELINAENTDYTVYNAGESLGSAFFAFNQNPDGMDPLVYGWMKQKQFRQALSCLLDRQRIADQVYRGLAVPAEYFFSKANRLFDESIKLEYTYDPQKAVELLAEIGIEKRNDGLMYDSDGNHIEFEIIVGVESNLAIDTCNIFAEGIKDIGITANVRPIDFQKLVEMLTKTYDWHIATASLGTNTWPSQGSNVWQSDGNFHLWHPLQEEPSTDWEARVDYLYNEGRFTLDPVKSKEIYDEYQRILLEQVPLTYIVYPISFRAYRNKWGNMYVDQLQYPRSEYFFLKDK